MKNLRLSITALALLGGVFGAFAFAPAQVKSGQASAQYYVDDEGNPQGLVDPEHTCINESTIKCSATFLMVGGQPTGTGTNIQYGPRL